MRILDADQTGGWAMNVGRPKGCLDILRGHDSSVSLETASVIVQALGQLRVQQLIPLLNLECSLRIFPVRSRIQVDMVITNSPDHDTS